MMDDFELRYRDLMPPPGWKPKSRHFQWATAKADYERTHERLALPCPHCGEAIPLVLTTDTEKPDFVIREDP